MADSAVSKSLVKSAVVPARKLPADVDLVRSYLRDIGRVPLLSHEQEITLGRQVQELMSLEQLESELEG
ncbi:MAG TPA: sigma-70 factor domain-containing protein, partial [Prochlorococcus sp.]|nr:sigma-70 factor domain-containing protein [Prochlorococcus sp.]